MANPAGAGALEKSDFQWAIIYLPTADKYPFIKVPLIENTYLWMQAQLGINNENRMPTYTGNVAHSLFINYKVFMVLHATFFCEIERIVEVANRYYEYCINRVDPSMAADTAYALCAAILPPEAVKDLAIHVLLRPGELKYICRDSRPVLEIPPIVISPAGALLEERLK